MKHFSTYFLSSAIGRHLRSLLFVFSMLLSASVAYGRTPTIYGQGLPGLNTCEYDGCTNWDNNTVTMLPMGDGKYYYEFKDVEATTDNKYRLKIAVGDGNWWDGAMTYDNVSVDKGNVAKTKGKDGDSQISFHMPWDGDVYVFYDPTATGNEKVWIVAVPSNIAEPPGDSSNRRLRTDLILDQDGWTSTGVNFARNDVVNTYKHVVSYILPAKQKGEKGKPRFQMWYGNEKKEYVNGKTEGAELSESTPRRIIYLWDGNQNGNWTPYTLPTYPVRKSGWKLFIKNYNNGEPTNLDANGTATITLNAGETYDFFIANDYAKVQKYDETYKKVENKNKYEANYPAVHTVNWFGGCYVDQPNCLGVSFKNQQVYNGAEDKLGSLNHPIVGKFEQTDENNQDLRGRFTVDGSGAQNVTFSFDGGKITIKASSSTEQPTPEQPSGVTYDGTEYFYFHKSGGSLNWGTVWADNCKLFLEFVNTTTNETKRSPKPAFFWGTNGTGGDVLACRVPEGTWHQVRLLRTSYETETVFDKTWENMSDYCDLEKGKNYLQQGNTMGVYDPNLNPLCFYVTGNENMMSALGKSEAWQSNGDNTPHYGSVEITVEANTKYVFKLIAAGQITTSKNNKDGWWYAWNQWNYNDVDQERSVGVLLGCNECNKNDNIEFTLEKDSKVTIACDGFVTVNAEPITYTVTFNTGGGTEVEKQTVEKGKTVDPPSDPTRWGYKFDGWYTSTDYTETTKYKFETPVTADITLYAKWIDTQLHSISLNNAKLVVGNKKQLDVIFSATDAEIIETKWESSNETVATVDEGGWVEALSKGETTITVTATDKWENTHFATCVITVKTEDENCETEWKTIFSYTANGVTDGGQTKDVVFFDEKEGNTEPEYLTLVKIAFMPKENYSYKVYDPNTELGNQMKYSVDNSEGDQFWWYKIDREETTEKDNCPTFALKNKASGFYLAKEEGGNTNGWSWVRAISSENITNDAIWYMGVCIGGDGGNWGNRLLNYAKSDCGKTYAGGSYFLHIYEVASTNTSKTQTVVVGCSEGPQGNDELKCDFTDEKQELYPAYLKSPIDGYYRMSAAGTAIDIVLDQHLKIGDEIIISLRNDQSVAAYASVEFGEQTEYISIEANTTKEVSVFVDEKGAKATTILFKSSATSLLFKDLVVRREMPVEEQAKDPALKWNSVPDADIEYYVSDGDFTYTAMSEKSLGEIIYTSSDETIALVDATTGVVSPQSEGKVTITATIEQDDCFAEQSIEYTIQLTYSLQDLYNSTEAGGTMTLTKDYVGQDLDVDKQITIEGNKHEIGNLTVLTTGDLTLTNELTINDFTIIAASGQMTTGTDGQGVITAASGQVHNADKITLNGDAYFELSIDPHGYAPKEWYVFAVPFAVDVNNGVSRYNADGDNYNSRNAGIANITNGVNYMIMRYNGQVRANGLYAWERFSGNMEPGRFYTMTIDADNNIYRFRKVKGEPLVNGAEVELKEYKGTGDPVDFNWNGVGNSTLYHANANFSTDLVNGYLVNVYLNGENRFVAVENVKYTYVVSSAFFVQPGEEETMMMEPTDGNRPLLAPARRIAMQEAGKYTVHIATEGGAAADNLFVSAADDVEDTYKLGKDLTKMASMGTVSAPQLWVNAYGYQLSANHARMVDGVADFDLTLSAPVAGKYTLSVSNKPEDGSQLWLTQDGMLLWNIGDNDYTLDLSKGENTGYGLQLISAQRTPTALNAYGEENNAAYKFVNNGKLYILYNGIIFDATGKVVK